MRGYLPQATEPPSIRLGLQQQLLLLPCERQGLLRCVDLTLQAQGGYACGGLHHDDVPSAAHGHADCLSVVLWLGGRPVLVDPGFYCYNGDASWEIHFRRTLSGGRKRRAVKP